ncbi:rod shape-determining protein MreD [bacterium F11]|nr:rod shape-determining protein MreD [bacterium F11]
MKFLYVLTTIIIGIFIHVVFARFFSFYGVSPQLLLLLVVTHGFLKGPLMGETLGFCWGLMMDAMGVNFFGLQSLLFALAGYISGTLRRRVASERPTAQLLIALITTLYYFIGMSLVAYLLDGYISSIPWVDILLAILFNVLLIMLVFWSVEKWIVIWKMDQEHN